MALPKLPILDDLDGLPEISDQQKVDEEENPFQFDLSETEYKDDDENLPELTDNDIFTDDYIDDFNDIEENFNAEDFEDIPMGEPYPEDELIDFQPQKSINQGNINNKSIFGKNSKLIKIGIISGISILSIIFLIIMFFMFFPKLNNGKSNKFKKLEIVDNIPYVNVSYKKYKVAKAQVLFEEKKTKNIIFCESDFLDISEDSQQIELDCLNNFNDEDLDSLKVKQINIIKGE